MRFGRIIGTAFILFLALDARADEASNQIYPLYAGMGFGFTMADASCDYYGYNCDGNDQSIKLLAGKRLHENFAIELSYQDLGKLKNRQGALTTTAESSGFNLSLVGIIPFDHLGYLYGKVGGMAWETDYSRIEGGTTHTGSDEGTEFTYGFGFAFTFDEKYEFRIEFERLNELDDRFTPGGDYITQLSFAGVVNLY